MKILFVTDAWEPHYNGVQTTAVNMRDQLNGLGHKVEMLVPSGFGPTVKLKEFEAALLAYPRIRERFEKTDFNSIHIDTPEGPLGLAAVMACRGLKLSHTTSYHTRFPQYAEDRYGIPPTLVWKYLRFLHSKSSAVLVPSEMQKAELLTQKFNNVALHGRGFDPEKFYPDPAGQPDPFPGQRPVWVLVGRVAPEKRHEDVLQVKVPGLKRVVGDGPDLARLKEKYPDVEFCGALFGEKLRKAYASADYFCFPSHSDTYGVVNIEALASGTPVVSHDGMPISRLKGSDVCITAPTIKEAMEKAAEHYQRNGRIPPKTCAAFARANFSWQASAQELLQHLVPARPPAPGVC